MVDRTFMPQRSTTWCISIIVLASVLFGIAVLIILSLIPFYVNPKSNTELERTTSRFHLAYVLSADLSAQISNNRIAKLRAGTLSNDQIILLEKIFQEKLITHTKSSNIRLHIVSAGIILSSFSSRANRYDQFTIFRKNQTVDASTNQLNISFQFSCRPFCLKNSIAFVLQNVFDQFNIDETVYFSLFTETVSLMTTTTSNDVDQNKRPIFNRTALISDIKDSRILQINNTTLFGTKDFSGNVQQIYAIQTANTIYTLNKERIVQIQTKDMTMTFKYNDTTFHYSIHIVTKSSSYEMSTPFSTPNVTFSIPTFNVSKDEKLSSPFTGILVQVKNQKTGRSISDAVMQLSYSDEQFGNTINIMMNVGGGKYYLPLPNNDTTMDHLFNVENLRRTTSQQCAALIELLRAYPMGDICSKNKESTKVWCSSIANEMSDVIPKVLSRASNSIDQIPIEPKSYRTLGNFQTIVSIPGENTVTQSLNSLNQVHTPSVRNSLDLNMLVLNIFNISVIQSRGSCNEATVAGSDTPDDRIIDIGQSHLEIKFRYETYVIPDEIQVFYNQSQIFTSTCLGTSGERETIISLDSDVTSLRINVIPNCQGDTGTLWIYSTECPGQMICSDGQCYCGTNRTVPTQVKTPTVNHCGSNGGTFIWLTEWIDDNWNFSPACDNHDRCYGTCGNSKSDCDDHFLQGMRALCNQNWTDPTVRENCLGSAEMFYTAVRWFGGESFESGQRENCECFRN